MTMSHDGRKEDGGERANTRSWWEVKGLKCVVLLPILVFSNYLVLSWDDGFWQRGATDEASKRSKEGVRMQEESTIAFLHYHKTGQKLSRRVYLSIRNIAQIHLDSLSRHLPGTNASRTHDNITKCSNLKHVNRSIFVYPGPDLFCCDSAAAFPSHTKVLHFVRDPFSMALSAYLYHSQDPTPENWVNWGFVRPCETDEELLNLTLPVVGVSRVEMEAVLSMCEQYTSRDQFAGRKKKITLYDLLRELPRYDGLRIITAFYLFHVKDGGGGDLLRMAANTVRLQKWNATTDIRVMATAMDDWIGNTTGTAMRALDFLFGADLDMRMKWGIATDVETRSKKESEKGDHVTQQLITATERANLTDQLSRDPVVGGILLKLRAVMDDSHVSNGRADFSGDGCHV